MLAGGPSALSCPNCRLDVNTDSNTRQRDPCNWDSHLQALGQAAIAPTGSIPYRRRSVTFLFEPDARVMVWTEFYLFTLFAAYEYGSFGLRHHSGPFLAYLSISQRSASPTRAE